MIWNSARCTRGAGMCRLPLQFAARKRVFDGQWPTALWLVCEPCVSSLSWLACSQFARLGNEKHVRSYLALPLPPHERRRTSPDGLGCVADGGIVSSARPRPFLLLGSKEHTHPSFAHLPSVTGAGALPPKLWPCVSGSLVCLE